MRRIKFRVWDKTFKMMLSPKLVDIDFNEGKIEVTTDILRYEEVYTDEIKDFVLMQYTGLKDKKGKEIYEGDILKCKLHNGKYENYTIVWNEKDACFDALNKDKSNFMLATIWRISEVIGNIYENEDLLKQND